MNRRAPLGAGEQPLGDGGHRCTAFSIVAGFVAARLGCPMLAYVPENLGPGPRARVAISRIPPPRRAQPDSRVHRFYSRGGPRRACRG